MSKALTDNLARFLRELSTGFAFVGAEVPIQCKIRQALPTAEDLSATLTQTVREVGSVTA